MILLFTYYIHRKKPAISGAQSIYNEKSLLFHKWSFRNSGLNRKPDPKFSKC